MDQNFLKFKKRVWLYILIKCLSVGLSVGLVAVDAVLLPCTLCGVKLFWLFYVLIALGGFALGGGIAFLLLRTNDAKIAKQLDEQLNLDQRVQTALQYKQKDGLLYDMQRTNADITLASMPIKALPFKNIIVTALCGAVSLVSIPAAPLIDNYVPAVFAVAEEDDDSKNEEPKRDITDWEWKALDDLIDYVKASKKVDAFTRTGMVFYLEGLRAVLLDGVSQSSLTSFVQNTVSGIRNVVKDANAMDDISEEQQALNLEEEAYVIHKLYEIFSIQVPNGGDENPENPPEEENPNDPNDPTYIPGSLNVNDTPFFDPELGYVKCGEVRAEYYAKLMDALNEGTISREEWEHIIITYFGDLSAN